MSSGGSNTWEVVKGFCRRRTQQFREEVSKAAAPTVDPDVEAKCQAYLHLRSTTGTISSKLRELNMHVAGANRCINEIQLALKPPVATGVQSFVPLQDEELDIIAKKLEVFVLDAAERERALSATLLESAAELARFVEEAQQYEALQEVRRDNMLEYDFFRDKVEDLRKSPPSDGTRLPRNETRLEDWKMRYQDATNRLMNFMNNSSQAGHNALRGGLMGVTGQYGRYCEDLGRSARAVLTGGGVGGGGVAALQSVARAAIAAGPAAAAQNARRHVEQQAASQFQQNPAPAQQQPEAPPPPPPKKVRDHMDDPFSM